mgnify:CR=1 FL=1|jgi:hypothetical protein|tara:strand:+ start:430 stop:723 length:294 start_codon:yes stop_codon:yes gene_type:complete
MYGKDVLSVDELAWRRIKIKLLREIDWKKVKRGNVELVSLIFAVAEIMAKESYGISQRNQKIFYETVYKKEIKELWEGIKDGKYSGKEEGLQVLYKD